MEVHMLACKWMELAPEPWHMAPEKHAPAVYHVHIPGLAGHTGNLTGLLNVSENRRSEGYKLEKDRTRFIISRAALRIILSRYLTLPPADVEFGTGLNLKPQVLHGDWQFNVSHTDTCALIAVSNGPVGVDVEHTAKMPAYAHVLHKVFSREERIFIETHEQPSRAFYALWTRKEAVLKAWAKGIDDEISHIPCLDGLHDLSRAMHEYAGKWTVATFEPSEYHIASVALESNKSGMLRLFHVDAGTLIGMADSR